jgi:hypothetical protein
MMYALVNLGERGVDGIQGVILEDILIQSFAGGGFYHLCQPSDFASPVKRGLEGVKGESATFTKFVPNPEVKRGLVWLG